MGSRTRVPPAARSRLLILLGRATASSRASTAARFVRALELGLCFGISLCASRGDAQAVSLAWQAPPECAQASAVEASIRQLSSGLPSPRDTPVEAHVRIARARGRYQALLRLEIGSHRAERRLHARRCDELGEAVVRLIALALESEASISGAQPPERGTRRPGEHAPAHESAEATASENSAPHGAQSAEPAREAEAPPARASDVHEREKSEASAAPERRSTLRVVSKITEGPRERALHAGTSAGVFAGGPSEVQAALGAFVGWSSGLSYTQARFSGLLPRRIDIAPGASANVWSLALDLTQCALWGGNVRGGPCLVLSGLRSSAEVRGLSRATRQAALWASASAGVQLFWRVSVNLELSLSVSAGLPISPRPRFTVTGVGAVAAAKPWSSDARLGLSFRSK